MHCSDLHFCLCFRSASLHEKLRLQHYPAWSLGKMKHGEMSKHSFGVEQCEECSRLSETDKLVRRKRKVANMFAHMWCKVCFDFFQHSKIPVKMTQPDFHNSAVLYICSLCGLAMAPSEYMAGIVRRYVSYNECLNICQFVGSTRRKVIEFNCRSLLNSLVNCESVQNGQHWVRPFGSISDLLDRRGVL